MTDKEREFIVEKIEKAKEKIDKNDCNVVISATVGLLGVTGVLTAPLLGLVGPLVQLGGSVVFAFSAVAKYFIRKNNDRLEQEVVDYEQLLNIGENAQTNEQQQEQGGKSR